jgi:hypothetical protein
MLLDSTGEVFSPDESRQKDETMMDEPFVPNLLIVGLVLIRLALSA